MRTLLHQLEAFRRRARAALIAERLLLAVAEGCAVTLAAVVLDRVLRLPAPVRVVELAVLACCAVAWVWLRFRPALRFRPPLVEVALRLERGQPQARGLLGSGAEFERKRLEGQMAGTTIQAARDAAPSAMQQRLDLRPVRRAALAAAAGAVAWCALLVASPQTAATGLARLLTPWVDVQWPARTMVEPALAGHVHPRGVPLPLRARPVRGQPADMHVTAEYRVLRQGAGEWRSVVLTLQPDGVFERLVETDGQSVEVAFHTPDMETSVERVTLVEPPSVASAQLRVTPPEYAASTVDVRTAELGTGTDRRAVLSPPVLEGSQVELVLQMQGAVAAGSLEDNFVLADGAGGRVALDVRADTAAPQRWTLRWTARGPGVLEVQPHGEEGVGPASRIAFEIPSVPDAPPSIAIVEPASDETVTPDAAPLVVAEGRDDLGVQGTWLEAVRSKGSLLRTFPGEPAPAARVAATVPLKELGLQPGDSVVLTAYAVDAYQAGGTPRAPVASSPRVLRIISVAELTQQVRSRLGQMRDAAGRLRQEQRGIRDAAEAAARTTQAEGAESTAAQRSQLAGTEGRMMDRIGSFERGLAELEGRLERNGTTGDGLKESIQDARQQAARAAEAAQRAAAELPKQDGAAKGAQAAAEAERALGELESALERDQATAQLVRKLDALSERVRQAQDATRALEGRTAGKEERELGAQDRAALEQASQAQREAAAEARTLTQQLQDAAQEAERAAKPDPGAAQALKQAAEEAEKRSLARTLEDAAKDTQRNQLQSAQESQRQAQEALDAMRQAMRDQQRARNEELRRRMASLVESLRALLGSVDVQAGLLQAVTADDTPGLEENVRGMLALSRNASSITQDAQAAGNQTARVAELVDRAATQLDEGASGLRSAPADLPGARGLVGQARVSVQEALTTALAIERRARSESENRRRAELRDLYGKVLEQQHTARTSTEGILPPPGQQPTRRTLVESRRVAGQQNAVSGLIANLGARQDVAGSELYRTANEEMAESSRLAGADLSTGMPSRRTVMLQDQVERQLSALVESLADPERPEDPFAQGADRQPGGGQGESGGGTGAEGNQRMPPIAELKLLRTMAQQALEDTRAAAALQEADRAGFMDRISKRQERLVDLGQKWMKRMKDEGAKKEAPPSGEAPPTQGFGAQGAPPVVPPARPAEAPPASTPPQPAPPSGQQMPSSAPPASDEPSLDDVLGLPGKRSKTDDAAARQEQLQKALRDEKPADLLSSALDDLRRSAGLLKENEPGLSTQRLQESAVRKLDELIQAARRMQQEQQQQNQQQRNQQRQQNQQNGEQQNGEQAKQPTPARPQNDPSRANQPGAPQQPGANEPPPRVDPAQDMAQFDESRTAWGQLPARVRDAVRQGMRDPVSAAYRKMTQDYYRRMAEEARK